MIWIFIAQTEIINNNKLIIKSEVDAFRSASNFIETRISLIIHPIVCIFPLKPQLTSKNYNHSAVRRRNVEQVDCLKPNRWIIYSLHSIYSIEINRSIDWVLSNRCIIVFIERAIMSCIIAAICSLGFIEFLIKTLHSSCSNRAAWRLIGLTKTNRRKTDVILRIHASTLDCGQTGADLW